MKKITKQDWKDYPKDYKSVIGSQKYKIINPLPTYQDFLKLLTLIALHQQSKNILTKIMKMEATVGFTNNIRGKVAIMKYTQFDWQKKRIHGKLKKLDDKKLYVANAKHRPRKVIPYVDEVGKIFIKNPYNVNWIAFLSCDYFYTRDYYKLFK